MSHEIVTPTVSQGLEWKDLRIGIKNCIKQVINDAVVYSSWPLKYDIGQTVRLLTHKDSGKVHAWMISINRAEAKDRAMGKGGIIWDLNVRIWGMLGYDSTYSGDTQDTIEKEVRAITQVLVANYNHFGLAETSAFKTTGYVDWTDIDVHGFGDNSDVHVAQGNLKIQLNEHLTGY